MVIIRIVSDEANPIILKPTAADCEEIARASFKINFALTGNCL
jgi:hypothetical protein